jgi:hypothetical protein
MASQKALPWLTRAYTSSVFFPFKRAMKFNLNLVLLRQPRILMESMMEIMWWWAPAEIIQAYMGWPTELS